MTADEMVRAGLVAAAVIPGYLIVRAGLTLVRAWPLHRSNR